MRVCSGWRWRLVSLVAWVLVGMAISPLSGCGWEGDAVPEPAAADEQRGTRVPVRQTAASVAGRDGTPYIKKINFAYDRSKDRYPDTRNHYQTPTPPGWETYYGSRYTAERGYGWLTELRGKGRDRGMQADIVLPNGTETTLQELGRAELATYQDRHQESRPLVFRIDLPDGWYRVACTSVDPDTSLPLVDQRSFKCRAHDVVFAGANYGLPITVRGSELVEGSGIVEVTDGHLRIVIGDPAYGGWTWRSPSPWYAGWRHWWRVEYNYYDNWYRRLTRTIDPGFHAVRLNSLEIERVEPPESQPVLVFRDFFNRNDHADVNAGISGPTTWRRVQLHPDMQATIRTELYKTSLKCSSTTQHRELIGLLQQERSPAEGVVRYATRVSLFTGEGSQNRSGVQEAGLLLLVDPNEATEFRHTFVGIAFDSTRSATMGWLIYRVGDGKGGYRTDKPIPDTAFPLHITAGEHELIVEHDVAQNVLRSIRVNGVDVTHAWTLDERSQRLRSGRFGIRSAMHTTSSRVTLQQFYWYYRVDALH